VRLSNKYIESIKRNGSAIFGEDSKILLFGSRLDDNKKGGDIDLYVIPRLDETSDSLFEKKIRFLSKLQLELGEQKIDVVISKDKNRPIEIEALNTGVRL